MSSELEINEPDEAGLPDISTPLDLRPDLNEFGIVEYDRGVCEDTFENRQILRDAGLTWDYVYDQIGHSTGLISARSKEQLRERRLVNFSERRPLLTDPTNNNSDFLTGLDLIIDATACKMTPPWVIASTRAYLKEQESGEVSAKRQPKGLPHRCKVVKSDGIRCLMWTSGRLKDDGACRYHLKYSRKPGGDIERARAKIVQSAPYAVEVLEELMMDAQSEPVRLKASTEILDRAGVRGGVELTVEVENVGLQPHEIIAQRLESLRNAALGQIQAASPDTNIIDAEPLVELSTTETEETARPE